jgi:hypothetical protein
MPNLPQKEESREYIPAFLLVVKFNQSWKRLHMVLRVFDVSVLIEDCGFNG